MVAKVKFITPLFLSLHGVLTLAQTIEIRLVDGRNGRPMAGAASYVNLWVGTERKEAIAVPTNEKGIVRLELTHVSGEGNIPRTPKDSGSIIVASPVVKFDDSIRINVPYALCTPDAKYSWLMSQHFSTMQILQDGYVSPNTCGVERASPNPGQLVFYVRPLTLREKLKQ